MKVNARKKLCERVRGTTLGNSDREGEGGEEGRKVKLKGYITYKREVVDDACPLPVLAVNSKVPQSRLHLMHMHGFTLVVCIHGTNEKFT